MEADSIGIPILSFVVLQIVTAPLTWGFVWLCVRRYPGAVSLAAWNSARPVWSILWSLVAVGTATVFVTMAILDNVGHHPLLIAHIALDVYFLLVLRSAIVMQDKTADLLRAAAR